MYNQLFDLCEYNKGISHEGSKNCAWVAEKTTTLKWPTLGEMRNKNKRLVIFSDKSEDAGYGIIYVSNTMETQYDLSEYPGCEMRGEGRSKRAPIFVMNHFYKRFPITGKIDNRYSVLKERIDKCYHQENKLPNFIVVDLIGRDLAPRRLILNINQDTNDINFKELSDEDGYSGISNTIMVSLPFICCIFCCCKYYKRFYRHR